MESRTVQSVLISMSKIQQNRGQVEGLPANPRVIKDGKFDLLKKSIEDNPEMIGYRELLVYQHNGKYVIIGGNMRYAALKELGVKEVPCKVISKDATIDQLKAYVIKDNAGYGEWDFGMLEAEWNDVDVADWGVDIPTYEEADNRIDSDRTIGDTSLRLQGKNAGYARIWVYSNDVCPTMSTSKHYLVDFPRTMNDREIKCCGSYPQDYKYPNSEKLRWMVGMSVPPVMTANIAWQIYKQWISNIA